jgi:hypothetical protein
VNKFELGVPLEMELGILAKATLWQKNAGIKDGAVWQPIKPAQ